MSSKQDFTSQVCNAFKKAVESAKELMLEGREREFRRVLTSFLFDVLLGWEGHSKIGEIYDITCFDEENFPIIVIETKWGVEPTREIKEKLRKRIEELGSVKYGVFASERDFIVYAYEDHKLREITKVNVAEAVGVAKGEEYGLSEIAERRVLKLEQLKRERLVWIEDPDYFEKTNKEISVAKREGVELLTENLKEVIRDATRVLVNFFDSYQKRKDHYSGSFLESTFKDWLRLSVKDEDFKKGKENERRKIVEVFCRETAYVLLGKILFTRICEDKDITKSTISGKGLAESLRYYEKRRKNPYLLIFDEAREEIGKYYTHLYELGYFDWWWISPEKIGVLGYEDKRIQDALEEDLNDSIKKMFRRFNRFDFTQVDRDILGDVYQGYLPPNERKRLGEFYTPKEVIAYILDAVGYKPEKEIRGKKILDPACGSGSFLVEAMQRLIERYGKVGFNLKDPDDTKQVIEGCISSIHGLDIHPFACFIAEMNLLFQLVDLYDVVRQKHRYYELPRLNIFISDSLVPSGETKIELMDFVDNSRYKMLLQETKGAAKVKNSDFDYIVGNPPYVRIHRLSKDKIHYYKQIYYSPFGKFDLYILFIERGIKWLKDGGKLGFITSDMFIRRDYGRKLRSFVLENCVIEQFIDFGVSGVFKDVTNYPCIFVFTKQRNEKRVICCIRTAKPRKTSDGKDITLQHIIEHITKVPYSDALIDLFETEQSHLNEDPWILMPENEKKIFENIANSSTHLLKDICENIYRSIETGKDEVFIINKEKIEKYELESELLKRILKGKRSVRRWIVTWDGKHVIFPYEQKEGKITALNINHYPNTSRYLEESRATLEKRKWFGETILSSGRKWYELWNPIIFDREKLVTPEISNRNTFAYDTQNYYCVGKVFSLFLKLYGDIDFSSLNKYILALLNSNVLEFYFKHIASVKQGYYYEYMERVLERLPIKIPLTDENKELFNQVLEKVDSLLQLATQMESLKDKTKNFPEPYLATEWSFDKLANIIKSKSLSRSSYAISGKSLRTHYLKDLYGKEIFRIGLASTEYVDFYSEEVASYVLEVLKTMNRITKRELLELKIPGQPHLESLMGQYRKDRGQIVKNEETVKELEKQLNDLVYKLYDIAYKERRIIEEYLSKF